MIRLQVLLFLFVFIQTFETQAFVLSKHYKSKERQTLERVLSLLSHENFPSFEDHFSLGDWLSQRAIYFVAPFEPLAMSRSNQLINYPNLENIIPMDVEGNQGILIFMKNEGAFIYHAGKARSVLYTVRFETASRSINIPVISPRAGIIRTGQVFFDRPIKDELSLRGFQISQLVHEARHSDG
ncbi:MAG: hypothetical protein IT289_03030, partial [Oligoflexia bacterium]|nr:hypothetical protein [Oligoflexia bacterium]